MVQRINWEEVLYDFVDQSLNPQTTLVYTGRRIPFNNRQREAVNALAEPDDQVPQTANQTRLTNRVGNIPLEQRNTFTDLGNNFRISQKVVASTLINGPPGTGKTHVICSGSILRMFNQENLRRLRRQSNRALHQRVFIATFSNAGAYRIYEKFHEIAILANTPQYHERIKLVQSEYMRESYAFEILRRRLNLNPDDYTMPNKLIRSIFRPDQWRAFLRDILIFVGTTDSLGILTNNTASPANAHGVIYDEASQLTIPQFFQVIPTHPMRSVIVVGDDAQLPPVSTLAPLGVSTLSYLQGTNTYQNSPIPISRRIELQQQYRMHPAIAQLTERLLRNTRLVIPDGPTIRQNYLLSTHNFRISNLPSNLNQSTVSMLEEILLPEHTLVIIDTSNIPQALDRRIGRSRVNEEEGHIAIGIYNALNLAYQDLTNEDIILTTPYRPQVRFFMNQNVRTGTVHQFQGQEAEAVIYSLTFAQPGTKSDFFSQVELMYVGLSRAKKKLIIIGNQGALDHPDPAIQLVRNTIFNFQYTSGRRGFPSYQHDPVCHLINDNQFLIDIVNNLL